MRILFIHDNPLLQGVLSRMLQGDGHEVVIARNGHEALEAFRDKQPDLILTDDDMVGMDGVELIRALHSEVGNRYVPIIMSTHRNDASTLHQTLGPWPIEFVSTPFNLEELRCRLAALGGLAVLSDHLRDEKAHNDEEIEAVKYMLDKLLAPSRDTLPARFSMETLQTTRINGDASAYRQTLPGLHFGLLCDAMGHGLMAGISTIPVVEAFLTMVNRDLPLEIIYKKINHKLLNLLPVERFTCLTLFRLDALNGTLSILNAGMPDVLLLRKTGELRTFSSTNLPAGIRIPERTISVQETRVAPGDRFLAISDGMEELVPRDKLIRTFLETDRGREEGLLECTPCRLRPTPDPAWKNYSCAFCHEILDVIGNLEQHDDVSWACWEIPPLALALEAGPQTRPAQEGALEAGLVFSMDLRPERSPLQDLLPQILRLLSGQGVRRKELETLSLLLSETLANAFDHGLLRLDSSLKETSFEAYEGLRQERQSALKEGHIGLSIHLWHLPGDREKVAVVQVQVSDSGPGFDWQAWLAKPLLTQGEPSGRGLFLIKSLARNLAFNAQGNQISFEVVCG